MKQLKIVLLILMAGIWIAGCSANKRPDTIALNCTDELRAAQQMAHDLFADPKLNQSGPQWTLSIGSFDDLTVSHCFDISYDVFLERLRTEISESSLGQVALVQSNPNPAIPPNYTLEGKATDLAKGPPNCFLLQFTIYDSQTHAQLWCGQYEAIAPN
jgi:hypothetical protein